MGRKLGSKNKTSSRSKFIIFKITNDKVKYHSTQFGILDTCKVTGQHNANIYCYINGKINTLGDWIVIKDKASKFESLGFIPIEVNKNDEEKYILSTNDDNIKYYEKAMIRFYKMQIQQNLIKNENINTLDDEKIKSIYQILKNEKV